MESPDTISKCLRAGASNHLITLLLQFVQDCKRRFWARVLFTVCMCVCVFVRACVRVFYECLYTECYIAAVMVLEGGHYCKL